MAVFDKPDDLSLVWASSGEKRKPSDGKIAQGFVKEIPKFQDFNYINGKQDAFAAHVNQVGIPVWDSVTEYLAGKSRTQANNGVVYLAITTNTNIDPMTDVLSEDWVVWSDPATVYMPPVNLTPAAGFTTSGVIPTASAQVKNGMLILNGGFSLIGVPLSSGTLLTTLPLNYRPYSEKVTPLAVYPSSGLGGTALMRLATNGQITITLGNWGTNPATLCVSCVVAL